VIDWLHSRVTLPENDNKSPYCILSPAEILYIPVTLNPNPKDAFVTAMTMHISKVRVFTERARISKSYKTILIPHTVLQYVVLCSEL